MNNVHFTCIGLLLVMMLDSSLMSIKENRLINSITYKGIPLHVHELTYRNESVTTVFAQMSIPVTGAFILKFVRVKDVTAGNTSIFFTLEENAKLKLDKNYIVELNLIGRLPLKPNYNITLHGTVHHLNIPVMEYTYLYCLTIISIILSCLRT